MDDWIQILIRFLFLLATFLLGCWKGNNAAMANVEKIIEKRFGVKQRDECDK